MVHAIGTINKTDEWNAIGIIETLSVVSSIEAGILQQKQEEYPLSKFALPLVLEGNHMLK